MVGGIGAGVIFLLNILGGFWEIWFGLKIED
jgi:hypothetical protein